MYLVKPINNEKGSLIMMVLFVLAIISIIGLSMSRDSSMEQMIATSDKKSKQCFFIAEGAVYGSAKIVRSCKATGTAFLPSGTSYYPSGSSAAFLTTLRGGDFDITPELIVDFGSIGHVEVDVQYMGFRQNAYSDREFSESGSGMETVADSASTFSLYAKAYCGADARYGIRGVYACVPVPGGL